MQFNPLDLVLPQTGPDMEVATAVEDSTEAVLFLVVSWQET